MCDVLQLAAARDAACCRHAQSRANERHVEGVGGAVLCSVSLELEHDDAALDANQIVADGRDVVELLGYETQAIT